MSRALVFEKFLSSLFLFFLLGTSALRAEDPSIDRLLSKLPPPEKLVRPTAPTAVQIKDAAVRDPLAKRLSEAMRAFDFPRALTLARQLCAKYPKSGGASLLRGVLAQLLRQPGEASASYHHALAIDSKFALAYLGLAEIEAQQHHFASAIPPLKQLVRVQPNALIGWYALSDCEMRCGHKDEALQAARHGAAVAPSSAFAWLQLARTEKASGHMGETLRAMVRAAEVSPDSGPMLAAVGYSYVNMNKIHEAVPVLSRAARLLPNDSLVHAQLGFCLENTGQLDAAVAQLRKGASLAPKYGPVWEHLGLAYRKQGKHQDAAKAFEVATRLMPNAPLPRQHLREEDALLGRAAKR